MASINCLFVETKKFAKLVNNNPSHLTFQASNISTSVIYYRKRGWYLTNSEYEYWTTTDPASSSTSGHSLLDITIIGSWRT